MNNAPRTASSARPNRGGGRSNRSAPRSADGRGRGRGGVNSRTQTHTAASMTEEDLDEDDTVLEFKATKPEPIRVTKKKSYKISMQKLSMTPENQAMVHNCLLHLNENPNYAAEEEKWPRPSNLSYTVPSGDDGFIKSLPRGHQFRLDNRLVIEGSVTNTARPDDDPELLYQFQIKKLEKYGFDRQRCLDALITEDGDIGGSLESLLAQCLPNSSPCDVSDAVEQRSEEALALSSIYADQFVEKIPDRVWIMNIDLPILTRLTQSRPDFGGCDEPDDRPLCQWYLKGHCKFGKRCRLRHVTKSETDADKESANTSLYSMEIRFPIGSRYPYQPPLIGFLSQNYRVKPSVCLNIAVRLMRESAELSKDGVPAIFSLLSILDDENELLSLVNLSSHPMSQAPKRQPTPAPYLIIPTEPDYSSEPDHFSDSDEESEEQDLETSLALNLETARLGPVLPPDNAVTLALKRRKREDKLYDRTAERLLQDNVTIRHKYERKQSDMKYQKLVNARMKLPVWNKHDDIVRTVRENQVTVISGTTGCGKSTQVPQFILDACIRDTESDLGQIICTQPRRISALAVSERVAVERNERLGDVVGYQIRLESQMSTYTRLMYCTTGILLRRLETDELLVGVSHVIIDEVHERSEDSDFLVMILRDLLRSRPDLKLILMSATLNADLFSQYFRACPVIDIPGKTFPVSRRYLEDVIEISNYTLDDQSPYARPKNTDKSKQANRLTDSSIDGDTSAVKPKIGDRHLSLKQLYERYPDHEKSTIKTMSMMDLEKINNDLIEALLKYIITAPNNGFPRDGAILIFMPGFVEITNLYDQLMANKVFTNKDRFMIIPLHSSLSSKDQQAVFKKCIPGVTKIVIATNIAETSITIDDVIYVIDTGRMKERRYDSNRNMESLETCWVSCANAIQREGRAGRVASGMCYHLFTSNQFHHQFREQPVPEIQRIPLERIVLKILILDLFKDQRIEDVLNRLLEPPPVELVTSAMERLVDLGALNEQMQLTPLGYHLAFLPVDVRIGKMMLYGVIMRCLDPVLTIAASLSYKSPFVSPFNKRDDADAAKHEFTSLYSDHLTVLKAYDKWLAADKQGRSWSFCQDNFLAVKTLQMLASLKRQYVELLSDIGFVTGDICMKRLDKLAHRGTDGVKESLPRELNSSADKLQIVSAVLCAALYPQVVQLITPEQRYYESGGGALAKQTNAIDLKFKTKSDGYVFVHPSSVNFSVRDFPSPFLVYHEKVKTSKVYLRDTSMVSPYALVLFAGGTISMSLDNDHFVLFIDDGWIRFTVQSYKVAGLLRDLRLKVSNLLEEKIANPAMDLTNCSRSNKIIETIVTLLTSR